MLRELSCSQRRERIINDVIQDMGGSVIQQEATLLVCLNNSIILRKDGAPGGADIDRSLTGPCHRGVPFFNGT